MAKKKSKFKTWIVVVAIIAIIVFGIIGMYNGLVRADVNVDTAWSQVETVYQRRADLIPNLVETVKGYAAHEKEVFLKVTEARSAWSNAKTPEAQVAAANGLESAIARLLLVVENYPDLKANQNFLALQDELANTENKIAVERKRYNDAVGVINKKVRFFPTNILASMFGFEKRTFFEAEGGAEVVPVIEFE